MIPRSRQTIEPSVFLANFKSLICFSSSFRHVACLRDDRRVFKKIAWMDSDEDDSSYKVVVVGSAGVGKTSIVHRYSTGRFEEPEQTIGVGYVMCHVELESSSVTLNVWDTAGQEKFQSLIPLYLRGADACILVFDLTVAGSVDDVDKLYNSLKSHFEDTVLMVLCGNKLDLLPRILDPPGIVAWAGARNLLYFRTSAVTGQGIDPLFNAVGRGVLEKQTSAAVTAPTARDERTGCC
jgi:Ras-related protein Rab-5C